jgi:hypothetical protein
MARLMVETPDGECEVDLLKEALGPPAVLDAGPVVALGDAVGLKVRALHGRTLHRDFIDVHAAASQFAAEELERLGARHTPGFSLAELADRLGAVHMLDDESFRAYGLDDRAISAVRGWATQWETDIRLRLAEELPFGSSGDAEPDWERYLDERG